MHTSQPVERNCALLPFSLVMITPLMTLSPHPVPVSCDYCCGNHEIISTVGTS